MRVRFSVGADSAFPDLRLLPATAPLRLGPLVLLAAIVRLDLTLEEVSLGSSELSTLGEGELPLDWLPRTNPGCTWCLLAWFRFRYGKAWLTPAIAEPPPATPLEDCRSGLVLLASLTPIAIKRCA